MHEITIMLGGSDAGNGKRVKSALVACKDHANTLREFGRYPHRNELLGRTSTAKEKNWLSQASLPPWAQSVEKGSDKRFRKEKIAPSSSSSSSSSSSVSEGSTDKKGRALKVLVLHGNRAHPGKVSK